LLLAERESLLRSTAEENNRDLTGAAGENNRDLVEAAEKKMVVPDHFPDVCV
jgi:hypothetical protein